MSNSPSPLPRRRGAPPGNHNAVKHGFYSSEFKAADLSALAKCDFIGLEEEISLLRLFIRQVLSRSAEIEDFSQLLEALRVVSLASSSLARLVKTNIFVASSSSGEASQAIKQALEQIGHKLELAQDIQIPPASINTNN